jgi:hypothetical protein
MRRLASVGVVGLLAAGVLACGGEQKVDLKKAQKLVESNLTGTGGTEDVRCPENVTYKKGRTFEGGVSVTSIPTPTPFDASGAPSGAPPTPTIKNYAVTVHMIGNGKLQVGPGDLHEG